MLHRIALTLATSAAASLAALSAAPPAAYAASLPLVPLPVSGVDDVDRLTVTVSKAGGGMDGTFELDCHPMGGSHPDAQAACDQLDRNASWGKDPFAPAEPRGMCTMQYGGPATARVTGTWAGRPVDATYERRDGCEIARWDALVPVLPKLSS
ncbi:SSI family serine proteinase inhibitor [Streptomyces sp. NBC_00878]|uniref:SSI family serine proteinase inhibitor n=1 Tax=Streptomyces sp. NBC_00878 TaxID=2975854 RepID=UPI0022536E76|nr:SSI family serine proteinase inhibitor [Streptomyces sp. NBC_00878]MCX4907044.1 subtilase-type protease inhibitor [Streptomyces sp. NBC_00878]